MLLPRFILRVPFNPIKYITEVNPGKLFLGTQQWHTSKSFVGWARRVVTIVSFSFYLWGSDADERTVIWKVLGNSNKRRYA